MATNVKRTLRKALSILMVVSMILSISSVGAMAAPGGNGQGTLICEKEAHEHTAECYTPEHNDNCYGPHEHDRNCQTVPHEHNETCSDHQHDDSCYEYHEHDMWCYWRNCKKNEGKNLICDEGCKIEKDYVNCPESDLQDKCYRNHTLTCTKAEHIHDGECYTNQRYEWYKVYVQGNLVASDQGPVGQNMWLGRTYDASYDIEGTTLTWRIIPNNNRTGYSGDVDLEEYIEIPEGYKVDKVEIETGSITGVNSESDQYDNAIIRITIKTLLSEDGTEIEVPDPTEHTLTVNYVDTEGNVIADQIVETKLEGDPYTTTQLVIDGYTFDHLEGDDPSGYMTKDRTVTYVYTKDAPPEPTYYSITYSVTGEAPATASAMPADETNAVAGESKSVAADLTTTETTKNVVVGTLTFNGWETDDASVENGEFEMPENNVRFVGTWSFVATPTYSITYSVTGEAPATYSAIPADEHGILAGDSKDVAGQLTTTETTKNGVVGTWNFEGWYLNGYVMDGSFIMPAADVHFVGYWTFEAEATYDITYSVTGEAPATASAMPANESGILAGTPEAVAADLTTTETTKNGVVGTWIFNGWTTDDVSVENGAFLMPGNDVHFVGTWTFEAAPTYKITYSVTGEAPATASAMPANESGILAGTPEAVAAGLTTTETTKNGVVGTWYFNGWTTDDAAIENGTFLMPGNDVHFVGTWTFEAAPTYKITYSVTGEKPDTSSAMPANESGILAGTPKTVAGNLTTTETTKNGVVGTWTFTGWKVNDTLAEGDFTMPKHDVHFVGEWVFDPAATYHISYVINGEAPATASATPATESGILAGTPKTVAGSLTTTETTKNGVVGTWTFDGWTTADASVQNGAFQMPANDVTFVGTWSFVAAPTYGITYTVTGETPATFSALPAAESGILAGTPKTVAGHLTTAETTRNGVVGSWIFNGWTTDDATVANGIFEMPANNVNFVGTWSFVATPTYSITYAVYGEAPATFSALPAAEYGILAGAPKTVAGNLTTNETIKNGVVGTWTFNGWTTADANVENGAFQMPQNNVHFVGSWSFVAAPTYGITYAVTGEAPATFSAMPANESGILAGTPKAVAANLTTAENTKNGVVGTWTFNGWTTADAAIENGVFLMPGNNVNFVGTWSFVAAPTYSITYAVTGEAPATFSAMPANESGILAGTPKAVAANLITGETTKNGVVGTWTFNGWTTADAAIENGVFLMPGNNVHFVGSWSFVAAPTYGITYSVIGEAPATASEMPAAESGILAGAPKTVAANLTTNETTKNGVVGTWTFNGWTTADAAVENGSFLMPNNNVAFVGTWSFVAAPTYSITYTVIGDAPATASEMPANESGILAGASKTVAANLTTTETTKDGVVGTWTFTGWKLNGTLTEGTFLMPNNNLEFIGEWTFDPAATYHIAYVINGDAPATASEMPATESGILAGTPKTVAEDLTTIETMYGDKRGTWTFNGWTTADANVENGAFLMPENNVVFVGTWSFVEDIIYTLTVNYVDEDGNALATQIIREYYAGEPYATLQLAFAGYDFEEVVGDEPNGIMDSDKVVTYIYSEEHIPTPKPPVLPEPPIQPPVDPQPPVNPDPDPIDDPIDIPEEEVPLADDPGTDIPEEDVPLTDIPDEEVPKTGDPALMFAATFCFSGLGLLVLKNSDDEDEE